MNYEFLTRGQQADLIQQRLAGMEVEHYQHELSRRIGERLAEGAAGQQLDEARRMIAEAESAQHVIEHAAEGLRELLAALG